MKALFASLRGLERSLDFQRQRHELLSENIANLTTPAFVPKDLLPPSGPEATQELVSTHTAHFGPTSDTSTAFLNTVDSPDRAPGLDGNAVSLEQQISKLNAVRVEFGASASVMSRKLALLRYAASDGNG